jgi:predicted RNase H-like HicB family nuclease
MPANPNNIVIADAQDTQFCANHHDYPDLRAHGESPEVAARNLAQDFEREIEGASDDRRREPLRKALADVRAFVEQAR